MQKLGQLRLAIGRDVAIGPVGPDQDFAGSVEVEHGIAESRRQELRQVLQVDEFAARLRRAEMVGDANGELPVAPQLEQGLVVGRVHADAAAIDDAGDGETVHFAEKFPGTLDLLCGGRFRQFVEDPAERIAIADDYAGRTIVAVAFKLAAGGHIGIVVNAERLHRLGCQQQPVVEMLDIDRMIWRGLSHLSRGRTALFGKLLFGPAAGDQNPGPRRLGAVGLADLLQGFLQGRDPDPVDLGTKGQRGTDAVNVPVGQPGNDGAAAEIDQSCRRPRERLHRRRRAGGQHLAVADRQRLADRKILVDGNNLAVE